MDEHSAEASGVASLAAASASGSLPPLPEPSELMPPHNRHFIGHVKAYTASQMRAYAALVLEEAAKVCDARVDGYKYATDPWADEHVTEATIIAAAIRALKP
jgi:hypothetical protein